MRMTLGSVGKASYNEFAGKRKRFLQIIFGLLALVFTISFVGFGIGSDAGGGLFDAVGIGGGQGDCFHEFSASLFVLLGAQ